MSALTDNGALSHATTGSALLDFFSNVSRNTEPDVLDSLLERAWNCDRLDTLKLIFHLRDCRGGKGEKKQFQNCLKWLSNKSADDLRRNLHLVPEFGYYKDLLTLEKTPLENDVVTLLVTQLKKDYALLNTPEANKISLVAKWAPSEGLKYNHLVRKIYRGLGITAREYRKEYLVPLRRHLKIVETLMCQRQWDEINFKYLPSVALFRYKEAFLKHCPENYRYFLKLVKEGRTKLKTGQLHPHEIITPYIKEEGESETIELTWKNYIDDLKKKITLRNSLAVVDVSGSMTEPGHLPLRVAISLGLILGELSMPPFYRKWITFSSHPTLEEIKGESLYKRIKEMKRGHWELTTNLEAVFDLLLAKAQEHQLEGDAMIKTIYILSDMQFDVGVPHKTNFEVIDEKYKRAGFTRPHLIFWSINNTRINFPTTSTEKGVSLISGFSPSIIDHLLKCKDFTPYSIVRGILDHPRYSVIT